MATNIWPAVSGAVAQSQLVDTVANNLANVDTQGFKKDMPTFKEYLTTFEREHEALDIPRGPIKDKEFYPLDGRDQAFVINDGSYTNFKQGNLRVTQSPFDLALDGPGFFEVSTPKGVQYTRQGSLKVTTDGLLVTTEGYPVLASQPGGLVTAQPDTQATVQPSQGGLSTQGGVAAGQTPPPNVAARYINLRDLGKHLTITESGEIYAGDQLVSQVSVAEFRDMSKLRKNGGLRFTNPDPANRIEPAKTKIRQGMVETSNVNPVEEMTSLIKAQRLFEQGLKSVRTYDDLMAKEANEIGKL